MTKKIDWSAQPMKMAEKIATERAIATALDQRECGRRALQLVEMLLLALLYMKGEAIADDEGEIGSGYGLDLSGGVGFAIVAPTGLLLDVTRSEVSGADVTLRVWFDDDPQHCERCVDPNCFGCDG